MSDNKLGVLVHGAGWVTIAAAQAGKHIVIEKPVANSVEEMQAMREAVHAAGFAPQSASCCAGTLSSRRSRP